jgi:tectonin beta-propeller repeat-containing protein 1
MFPFALGTSWSVIDEPRPESPLSQVSVGENVVWALSRDRKVWFRNGLHGGGAGESDVLAKGTKWIEMVGQLQMISK